jgi:hypothetical protein
MIDLLAKLLIENGLEPDSFTTSATGEAIFRGEVPAGRVMQTWVNVAKSAGQLSETGLMTFMNKLNAILRLS